MTCYIPKNRCTFATLPQNASFVAVRKEVLDKGHWKPSYSSRVELVELEENLDIMETLKQLRIDVQYNADTNREMEQANKRIEKSHRELELVNKRLEKSNRKLTQENVDLRFELQEMKSQIAEMQVSFANADRQVDESKACLEQCVASMSKSVASMSKTSKCLKEGATPAKPLPPRRNKPNGSPSRSIFSAENIESDQEN